MGNQPSRVNNAHLDNTTINETKGQGSVLKVPLRSIRRGVSENSSDYRGSDYNEMNKLANAGDWSGLLEKFRANPGYASFRDPKNHGCLPLHFSEHACLAYVGSGLLDCCTL